MQSNINDKHVKKLEEYLLTGDRKKFIDSLIKGSEEYIFFKYLHQFNDENKVQTADLNEIDNLSGSQQLNTKTVLRAHYYCKRYDQAKDDKERAEVMKDFAYKYGFDNIHHHSKPNTVTSSAFEKTDTKFATVFPQDRLSIEKKFESACGSYDNFSLIPPSYYNWLDLGKIIEKKNESVMYQYLSNADLQENEKAMDVLEAYMIKAKQAHQEKISVPGFILNQLTESQLKALAKKHPHFMMDQHFINQLFAREFKLNIHSYSINEIQDLNERRELVKKFIKWSKDNLPAERQNLACECHDVLVQISAKLNEFDENLFIEYLKNPSRLYYNTTKENQQKLKNRNYHIQFSTTLGSSQWTNSQKMIEQYLSHIFTNAKDYSKYMDYFVEPYLKPIFYKAKLYKGDTINNISECLETHELTQIQNEKEITICDYNQKYFLPNQPVKLEVAIKNVPKINIKVFEFCPENYYLKEKRQIEGTMNLDGLVTFEEHDEEYNEPAVKRVLKTFDFPSISQAAKGIFIVDFIGSGISTRAVIKKGKLSVLERSNLAGQIFNIIDENKEVCKGKRVGMWVQDKFHEADEKGDIFVQYSASGSGTHQAVLIHDNFAELSEVTMKQEQLDFKCAYIYQEESFLMGNQAKIIVQPRLYVNGQPSSFEILKDFSAQVITKTDENVPTTHHFEDLKPTLDKDIILQFPIPPRLMNVEVVVNASATQMYTTQEKKFSSNHSIPINIHQETDELVSIYLKPSQDGYYIYVLGKNGEPKSKIRVNVNLQPKFYHDSIYETLETDEDGKITLGKLENIASITVDSTASGNLNACHRYWTINADKRLQFPSVIYLTESEKLNLPLLHSECSRKKLRFVEILEDGSTLRDALDEAKVKERTLELHSLKPGFYKLTLKDIDQVVNINVVKGTYWKHNKHFIETKNSLLNVRNNLSNVVIHDVQITKGSKDGLSNINISAYSDNPKQTRFHILGSQFLEENPTKIVENLDSLIPSPEHDETPIYQRQSIYLNNRKLGDEYTYVLERKNKPRFMGNTLDQPQILLKRTFVRDTETQKEELNEGGEFAVSSEDKAMLRDEESRMKSKKKDKKEKWGAGGGASRGRSRRAGPQGFESFLNFLANPTLICENAQLDDNYNLVIKDVPLLNYSHIKILGSNIISNVCEMIPLAFNDIKTRDLRLKSQLKADTFYSQSRKTTQLLAGNKIEIKDMTSTELKIIDSVPKLFDIQKALRLSNGKDNENGQGYDFWKYLKRWDNLSEREKIQKYDEFASHELNMYIYVRDQPFFNKVVRPFIKNKIEKDNLDYILLEDKENVLRLAAAHNFAQLNSLEMAMLALALNKIDKNEAKQVSGYVESKGKTIKLDTERFNLLYEAVLKSKVEGDNLDELKKAKEKEVLKRRMQEEKRKMEVYEEEERCLKECEAEVMMQTEVASFSRKGGAMKSRAAKPMRQFDAADYELSTTSTILPSSSRAESFAVGLEDSSMDIATQLQKRQTAVAGFQEMGKTKEYMERNYYGKTHAVQIQINKFWVEAVQHFATHGQSKPFLPESFIFANSNHTEMIGALALVSLPYEPKSHQFNPDEGLGLNIVAASESILFQKEIAQGEGNLKKDILVAQRFFDPQDRYGESEEDPGVQIEKEVEQFVINKIYGCKVTITNCSIANQAFQVLLEVPEGSIPVRKLDYTKSHSILLSSTETRFIEFFFYFPKTGKYPMHPASVSKNGKIVATAEKSSVQVDAQRVYKNLESFTAILSQGSEADIINFVKTRNLLDPAVFRFNDIWWLLKNKDIYTQIIQILRERKIYDHNTWGYSFLHSDFQGIKEYLNSNKHSFSQVQFLNSSLLQVDQKKLREYHPYVNPRVHLIASEENQILNKNLKQQYRSYIRYLCEVNTLKPDHYLTFVYYLLLQDRIEDAIKVFGRLKKEDLAKNDNEQQLQYDYSAAYLDFYTGYPDFKVAREIAKKYQDYPILSWRALFVDVANQLAEFDGKETSESEELKKAKAEDKSKDNLKNAQKEEILSMELEKTKLIITYQNIKNISIFFYKVDLEVLFSRNPFLSMTRDELTFIRANHEHTVPIANSTEVQKSYYEIPPTLQSSNLFIQLRSGNRIISQTYFSTNIEVQVIEPFGQVKVLDKDQKPLHKVYVKCFAKPKNGGKASFYKDGYTDLRGRFDYATLSGGDVSNVDRFALLINSDEHGAIIKEADPPKKIGKH